MPKGSHLANTYTHDYQWGSSLGQLARVKFFMCISYTFRLIAAKWLIKGIITMEGREFALFSNVQEMGFRCLSSFMTTKWLQHSSLETELDLCRMFFFCMRISTLRTCYLDFICGIYRVLKSYMLLSPSMRVCIR